jgi:branched-chain amino acid transport system substrate-binding protein
MVTRTETRTRSMQGRNMLLAATVAGIALFGGVVSAQETIRIGSLNDQTGPFADTSGPGWVDAAKMAIEDFGGTVLGKKIELLSVDDRNNADHSLATVRGWLDNDGVKAILSGSNSPITLATVGLAKDRATPFMIAGAGISSLTGASCTPYSIQYAWDTYAMPRAAVEETMRKGAKSWFLITWNTGFGNVIEGDVKKFVEKGQTPAQQRRFLLLPTAGAGLEG